MIGRRAVLAAGIGALAATSARAATRRADALRPDPVADQSEAFGRAALAAAKAGRDLLLEPGLYRIANVALPDGLRLVGVPGRTRLGAAGPGPLLHAKGAARLALRGLVFDGAAAALGLDDALLSLDGIASLAAEDCLFSTSGGRALALEACGGRIEACTIEDARTALYANDSAGLSVIGNTVRRAGDNAILVHRSAKGHDGTIVSRNRIETVGAQGGGLGWNGNGINVFRAAGVIVSDNVIRDCAFSFVRANAADAVHIAGNACEGAGETGIYSEFAFEGAVIAGNTVDKAANGISVANFDKGGRLAVVQGNIVRGAFRRPLLDGPGDGYGAGIAVEADTAASGNVVEDCPRAGFALGYGAFLRDIALTANVVRRCGAGVEVTVVGEAGNVVIDGNIFSDCAQGAVVGMRWVNRVTEDLAVPGTQVPAGIIIGTNALR